MREVHDQDETVLRRARGPARLLRLVFPILVSLLHSGDVLAQGARLEAALPSAAKAGSASRAALEADAAAGSDPLLAIENALADARLRQQALEQARQNESEAAPDSPSPSRELADRLVRVLEQRRDAQIRTNELLAGREAIRSVLARDPRELFGVPPPFPVPLLDNVRQSWRREVEQEAQQRTVLADRRANHRLAKEEADALEKERRRLRDLLAREKDAVERLRLEAGIRSLDDRVSVARERVTLAEQRVHNATLEHEIKETAKRQARAALDWVEAHLAPRESDLADAIQRLDRERLDLDRELDLARSDLIAAEAALRAAEEERDRRREESAGKAVELESRRARLSHRQHRVALLNQQIERVGRMRTSWQHRYAVLGDRLPMTDAPDWLARADTELERLTRNRRIQEAELAELRLELAGKLRALAEEEPGAPSARRWRESEIEDLEGRIRLIERDLESLDRGIRLEEQLRAELADRLRRRDLGERMRGLLAGASALWSYELTTSEDRPITPGKTLIGLLVFVVGYAAARFLMPITATRLFPRLGFDAGASSAFASLTFYALMAAVFLLALRAVNIPLTAFAVVGGALALGIGFGSQAIVSNFISGLLLLAERPIRAGDLIEVSGVVGTVESIGLRSTRIRTADNFHIIVPNSSFLESNVVNWTHQDPNIRLKIVVGVAYGSPTRKVEELLLQVARAHPRCLSHPGPVVIFGDFGASALSFELRFWIRYDERTDRTAIQSDVRHHIDALFAQEGITIAFPQMDVHLDLARVDPARAATLARGGSAED